MRTDERLPTSGPVGLPSSNRPARTRSTSRPLLAIRSPSRSPAALSPSVVSPATSTSPARPTGLLVVSLLVIALLSAGCLARPSTGANDITPLFYKYWGPWQSVFFVAIMLGLGLVVLSFMYAAATRDDKLKNWCLRELFQLGYSVLILLVVLAIIASLSQSVSVLSQATLSNGADAQAWQAYVNTRCAPSANPIYDRPCHIRLAEDYLQILASASESQARTVLNYNSILSTASTISLSFRGMPDPSGYLDIAPLAGLSMPLETLGFVFDLANKNIMSIRFQQFLLEFLHLAFFPLFLSLGLFLRSLYFTRRLGGLFIALALGAYVVYPLMYVFSEGILFSFTGPWPVPAAGQLDAYTEQVGASLYPVAVDLGGTTVDPQRPVPGAPGYDESVSGYGLSGTKGQYSFDGIIQPWEECNEYPDSVRSDTGVANTQSFGCPPAGRPADYYCNANNARCTSDPAHGYGRGSSTNTRDANGRYLSPFREQFLDSGSRSELIKSASQLSTNFCYDPQGTAAITASQLENKRLMLGAAKAWQDRLEEGWGGAFQIALANDELLGFNGVIDNLAKILIFSLICPFIAIMVMLASIKALSPMLGGDVEIAGLTKLI